MLKLMGKEIFTILREKFVFILTGGLSEDVYFLIRLQTNDQ